MKKIIIPFLLFFSSLAFAEVVPNQPSGFVDATPLIENDCLNAGGMCSIDSRGNAGCYFPNMLPDTVLQPAGAYSCTIKTSQNSKHLYNTDFATYGGFLMGAFGIGFTMGAMIRLYKRAPSSV